MTSGSEELTAAALRRAESVSPSTYSMTRYGLPSGRVLGFRDRNHAGVIDRVDGSRFIESEPQHRRDRRTQAAAP